MYSAGYNKTIGDFSYNINKVIGEGFSAKVYLGCDNRTGQPVAVKVIEFKGIESEVHAMLLRNEVECHKRVSHENILKIYDQLSSANRIYMISEYCERGTLEDFLTQKGKLSQEMALSFIAQIIKAVNHIHSRGIIHRDIKSANILIKASGVLKLADFGFADFVNNSNSNCQYNVGSPVYMSPEAYNHSQYSVKSDVWSIGMILYELLVGYQPFNGRTWNDILALITTGQIYQSIPQASQFCKHFLSRMLDYDVNRRANTEELLMLLQNGQPMNQCLSPKYRPRQPFSDVIQIQSVYLI